MVTAQNRLLSTLIRLSFDCFPFSNRSTRFRHTQLASLLANRHERAKKEMKCPLRAQATVGVALTNDGSTSTTTKFVCDPIVCDAQSSLYESRKGAVAGAAIYLETRSFKGRCTAENLAAVSRGVAKRFYHLVTVLPFSYLLRKPSTIWRETSDLKTQRLVCWEREKLEPGNTAV